MPASVKVKVNREGCRAVMKSAGVQALMAYYAARAAYRCEALSVSGRARYVSGVDIGPVSAHGWVATGNKAARYSNRKHDSLRRSMGGV